MPFSAVLGGIKEIKAVMADAEKVLLMGRKTLLFVDEIHRFNKAQQDAFLPYVERGDVILVGATTENPSFEINSALLSRTKVFVLRALEPADLLTVLHRGLRELDRSASPEALQLIAHFANGDARHALNLLDLAAATATEPEISSASVESVLEKKILYYDKSGEEHYNLISALHKSVRSSDADAALYWLARMLASGEDRMFLARRLVRMAIEDIGLADPKAVEQAMACQQAVHLLGEPEGDLALGQLALYLAIAPKSDASYQALKRAVQAAESQLAEPVPLALRNAPTRLMNELGYAQGYQHAHHHPDAIVGMDCLPPTLAGQSFYQPTNRGFEIKIKARLEELKARRELAGSPSGEPAHPAPNS